MSRHLNAALTSGTSPGQPQRIHLIGPGAVGCALLRRIGNSRHTLVGVTDSSGTIHRRDGLDATAVALWKEQRRSFAQHPEFSDARWSDIIAASDADIVIDATSSVERPGWSAALERVVLEHGRSLILAAKTSLAERAASWLGDRYATRVGCNAVLGGTGAAFVRALPALRTQCTDVAIVGNATTTTIISMIERGASFDDGAAEAKRLGYLEPDPEADFRGRDAAVKLAIVAGAIYGRVFDHRRIACQDIRSLDAFVVRARARTGSTTRLVARIGADGEPVVAYESVSCDSILAAPIGRVVYEYQVRSGSRQIYIGEGLGANATAAAAWSDVQSISRSRGSSATRIATVEARV
jgi:homoserine dehydrogenase